MSGQAEAGELTALLAPAQRPDELGRLGSYRVLKVLGAGGMGVVFKAEDPQLGRLVALKAVLPSLVTSSVSRQRFLQEARAAAALKHDHVVTIHQVGEDRGVPFMALEFLEGEPLDARLAREPRLPLAEVLRIGWQTALGLAAAHKRGLIHRDIKPANLWLEAETDRVKILDFGLARGTGTDAQLTQPGAIIGTPAYMAPEQALGHGLDGRCDLFSLGCVLYRLCTGQQPFQGSDALATLMAVATEQPPPPSALNPALPASLSDLVMQLLAKNPAERPASAQAVVQALQAIAYDRTVQLAPPPTSRPAPPSAGRRKDVPSRGRSRRVLILGGAAAMLLGAGGAFLLLNHGGPDKEPDHGPKRALPAGTPLSPHTLVMQPAPLPGVESWSLEPRGHLDSVYVGCFSPDSRRVASGGRDGSVRLWDAATGRLLNILLGHAAEVTALAWSPDGTRLASGSLRGTIRLWDSNSGLLLHTLEEHSGRIGVLAWSVDGKRLASGSADRSIRLWDAHSGKQIAPAFTGHGGYVSRIAWRPDGKTLISASNNGKHCLWEAKSASVLHSLVIPGPTSWSGSLKVMAYPAGKKEGKTAVGFWEADTDRQLPPVLLKDLDEEIHALAWSADQKMLATGAGNDFQLWDAQSGKRLHASRGAHKSRCNRVVFSPDGKLLLTVARFSFNVKLWNTATGKHVLSLSRNFHVWSGWFSPDSQKVMTVIAGKSAAPGARPMLDVWEIASRRPWQAPPLVRADSQEAAWSPGSKQVACTTILAAPWGKDAARVRVWDTAAGRLRQVLSLVQDRGSRFLCAWSPDGKTLATSADHFGLQLWDPATAKPLRTLSGKHTGWIHALAWSPDSKMLASFAQEGWLWERATGQALRPLTGLPNPARNNPGGQVVALAWSPDGKTLASVNGYWNGVYLWETASGKHWKRLLGPTGRPAAVAWSPNGTILASGGADRTVCLWKANGELVSRLKDDQQGRITALAWLDGNTLATFGTNNRLCLWDTAGEKLRDSFLLAGRGRGRFSPDGRLLASLNDVAGVRLWETATGRPRGTLFLFGDEPVKQFVAVSPDGHYRAEPPQLIDREFVYVVRTSRGQQVLTPEAFANKYHHKNDPDRVHLLGR
jgi:WD40 repeat protein/serine/threonine protein kinase